MEDTFIVSIPRDSPTYEKSFHISKEKVKNLINNRTLPQIIDLGSDVYRDFLISHIAYLSYNRDKAVKDIVETLGNDFKEEIDDTVITMSENKLKEYIKLDEDNRELDFYVNLFVFLFGRSMSFANSFCQKIFFVQKI